MLVLLIVQKQKQIIMDMVNRDDDETTTGRRLIFSCSWSVGRRRCVLDSKSHADGQTRNKRLISKCADTLLEAKLTPSFRFYKKTVFRLTCF